MRGALEEVSVKSLRRERPDLPGLARPRRGPSPVERRGSSRDRAPDY